MPAESEWKALSHPKGDLAYHVTDWDGVKPQALVWLPKLHGLSVAKENKKIRRTLFCFWTGDNELPVRQQSLTSLRSSGLEVTLVTPQSLSDYIELDSLHPS